VGQGVAVLCKNEQPASAVFQFIELSFCQTIAKRSEFGIRGMVAHAACLPQQIPKRSNFCPELVEFNGGREFVGQEVALLIVQIIFILFHVSESALNLCKPLRSLWWC
jgi:hypothetical protein